MFRDFYSTIAQVQPVLLLALMWDSGYLQRLRQQPRVSRRVDPDGVRFWTKPRVRAYSLVVTGVLVTGTAVAMLVLGGMIADSKPVRAALAAGLVLALGTVLTRISVDVVTATAVTPATDQPAVPDPRQPAVPDPRQSAER